MAAEATEKKLLIGECKWRSSVQDGVALSKLLEKSSLFKDFDQFWYYYFSKDKFDAAALRIAKQNSSVALVGLSELFVA
jgi:hypothetical protein